MIRARAGVLLLLLAAGLALVGGQLSVSASQPFSPALDVSLSDPTSSANSDVATLSLVEGGHALASWGLRAPIGWDVASDSQIPIGDVVAQGTMSVDVDCDASLDNFGPFDLTNQPADQDAVGEWTGQITSWWSLLIAVDGSFQQGFDMTADLTNFSEFHTLCGPQNFALTIFGLSSPGNAVVVTNPSDGTYTWTGTYVSWGGAHQAVATDDLCVGPEGTDSDGDSFPDTLECHVGTDPLLACGSDAHPADFNGDGFFSGADLDAVAVSIGAAVPPASIRKDIGPNPIGDNAITGADLDAVAVRIGQACTP
jgi:hypothetical protein